MGGTALVLGGGGVTGIAWEFGILSGLAEAGVDLTTADLIVGTSAGSVVGAILAGGESVEEAYHRQLRPAPPGKGSEQVAKVGLRVILSYLRAGLLRDERASRARVGAMALRARTVPELERREIIAARLGAADWPTRQRLLVTAVAADDGEFVAFGRDSGVSLVDAVSASCAVPGVWPPVTVNGRRYIDGGTRAPANVDLAADCDRVVVLAPITIALRRSHRATSQVAALPEGTRRILVTPSPEASRAIGRNVLNPGRRGPAARAGRAQAAQVLEAARAVWSAS